MNIKVKALLASCSFAFAISMPAHAEQLRVMTSGGFTAAYKQLSPKYSAVTGDEFETILGPSMGKTPQAIPNRLDRGESADVVIMVGYALDELIKRGKVIPDSRVELADSPIGMVVRDGAPQPDISTVDALKETLLNAKSVAYSDSASGVYIQQQLFRKLGVEQQMKGKAQMIPKIPVASVVADGQYEIGFQQVSELLPVAGAKFVGRIPASVQSVTRYAAGIPVNALHPEEAKRFLQYLSSPAAQQVVKATGLDPVVTH